MIAFGHDTTPLCAPRPCSSCAGRIWFCVPIERLFLARCSLMNVFVSVAGAREPMSPTYLQGLAHLSLGEFGVALGGARVAVAEDALDDLQPLPAQPARSRACGEAGGACSEACHAHQRGQRRHTPGPTGSAWRRSSGGCHGLSGRAGRGRARLCARAAAPAGCGGSSGSPSGRGRPCAPCGSSGRARGALHDRHRA